MEHYQKGGGKSGEKSSVRFLPTLKNPLWSHIFAALFVFQPEHEAAAQRLMCPCAMALLASGCWMGWPSESHTWGCSQSGMHQHVVCQQLHHPVFGGRKKPQGYISVPTSHGKCNQAVPDPQRGVLVSSLPPALNLSPQQEQGHGQEGPGGTRRFVTRRTCAGFAFAAVIPNSSWSVGQLSWEECFQPHGALGLAPALPMGAGTGEGCTYWGAKTCGGPWHSPCSCLALGSSQEGFGSISFLS